MKPKTEKELLRQEELKPQDEGDHSADTHSPATSGSIPDGSMVESWSNGKGGRVNITSSNSAGNEDISQDFNLTEADLEKKEK